MSSSLNTTETVVYDRTLVLAIELNNKSWVLAAQVPGLPQTKAKRTIEPDKLALFNLQSTRIELVPLPLAMQSIGSLQPMKLVGRGSGWPGG